MSQPHHHWKLIILVKHDVLRPSLPCSGDKSRAVTHPGSARRGGANLHTTAGRTRGKISRRRSITKTLNDTASKDTRMPRKRSAAAAEKEPAVQAETEGDSQPPKDGTIGGGSHKIRMVAPLERARLIADITL